MELAFNNGIVQNAKGDLIPGTHSSGAVGNPSDSQDPVAIIEFDRASGDVFKRSIVNGIESTNQVSGPWVDTDGSDDVPPNPAPWNGSYEISWDAPSTDIGVTTTPSGPQSYISFNSDQVFEVTSSQNSSSTWVVNIRKTGEPSTEATYTLTFTVNAGF